VDSTPRQKSRNARDTAFAALALLRCRDRLAPILDTIAEPRRNEVVRAVAELGSFDDAHLKHFLAETVRNEDADLRDFAVRALGSESAEVPRAILKWAARGAVR
jgi:HEAT repeat protein